MKNNSKLHLILFKFDLIIKWIDIQLILCYDKAH